MHFIEKQKNNIYGQKKKFFFHKILPNSSKNHPGGKTCITYEYHTFEKPFNLKTNAWTKTA